MGDWILVESVFDQSPLPGRSTALVRTLLSNHPRGTPTARLKNLSAGL